MLFGHIIATVFAILAKVLGAIIARIMQLLLYACIGVLVAGFIGWKRSRSGGRKAQKNQ